MSNAICRILNRLLQNGSVPTSSVSAKTERELGPLLDSEAIVRQQSGRGVSLVLQSHKTVENFLRHKFPHNSNPSLADESLPPRSRAVALHKDAKRARTTTAEPLLLRATAEVYAHSANSRIELARATNLTGAVCLLIDNTKNWSLNTTIAIVENLETFLHFEHLKTGATTAIYAAGRLSERIIDWLASDAMQGCRYIHCGDYDPVGLQEFQRLYTRLGATVELYIPGNIRELFQLYGKPRLLQDSTAILAGLRSSTHPDIRKIVQLLDETGCGLEQEALLLPP
jgi:hypothetical protein